MCKDVHIIIFGIFKYILFPSFFIFFLPIIIIIPADILLTSSFYTASFVVTLSFLALLVLAFSFMTRGGKTSRPCLYLGIKPNYISGRVGR